MNTLSKIVIAVVVLLIGLVVVAGRTLRDAAGYVRASVAVNCVRRTERTETIDVRYRRCAE